MRRSYLATAAIVAVLSVICFAVSGVLAQTRTGTQQGYRQPQPQAQVALGSIVLIDISRVYKENNRFNAQMNGMKAKVKRAEEAIQAEVESLKTWVEEMKKFKAGSTEYKDWERRIAERQSDLKIQMQLTRKEFLQEEAAIYHRTYREIAYEVESVARANNVKVVLRFNGDEVDADNPEDVLRYINKPVVYHADTIDITNHIIASLNRRAGGPATPATPVTQGNFPPRR